MANWAKGNKIILLFSALAVLVWMVLIFNLSSQAAMESNKLSTGVAMFVMRIAQKVAPGADFDVHRLNHLLRKNTHFFAYLVLGMLTANVLGRIGRRGLGRAVSALGICILYAVSDEVHQLFVPGRGPGLRDVLLDSAGAALGIVFLIACGALREMWKGQARKTA